MGSPRGTPIPNNDFSNDFSNDSSNHFHVGVPRGQKRRQYSTLGLRGSKSDDSTALGGARGAICADSTALSASGGPIATTVQHCGPPWATLRPRGNHVPNNDLSNDLLNHFRNHYPNHYSTENNGAGPGGVGRPRNTTGPPLPNNELANHFSNDFSNNDWWTRNTS